MYLCSTLRLGLSVCAPTMLNPFPGFCYLINIAREKEEERRKMEGLEESGRGIIQICDQWKKQLLCFDFW